MRLWSARNCIQLKTDPSAFYCYHNGKLSGIFLMYGVVLNGLKTALLQKSEIILKLLNKMVMFSNI